MRQPFITSVSRPLRVVFLPHTTTTFFSIMSPSATSTDPAAKKLRLDTPKLLVKKLSAAAIIPTRGSALAAGYDIYTTEGGIVPAHDRNMFATDIAVAIPEGFYGRIAGRSGLATKHGIQPGAGVVDADYRGPLKILLFNHSSVDFEVRPGERVAQMIIEQIITPEIEAVDELPETVRGESGFGSTGGFNGIPATAESK
ncbi:DUTP-pyrophosphatase-LIKE 1 [Limtongia smithiae]|uniref:DUTP-pyrophosphatase-LIKE 1 n=1 Tax=Limtongia smithiae TaxID=1125753 RepID=UPI0034CEC14E